MAKTSKFRLPNTLGLEVFGPEKTYSPKPFLEEVFGRLG